MYQVEGYAFETKEQEHTAKHEVEIIGYIRKNTRMDDPDIVLALYNKLVLKEIFVTPVGYDMLERTEINMAYRKAEQERWKSFDFVVGYEVKITQNGKHVEDICDCLKGKYRKDFKFMGWHPSCYKDDMDVLTKAGWKRFKDVSDDDLIMSLNPDTREEEWVSVVDQQCYDFNGELVRFYNKSLDCVVTPDHRMPYENTETGQISYCTAEKYNYTLGGFINGEKVFFKEYLPYSGKVYDLTLDRNHIMYVRRNGKCFWGSNCMCYTIPILKTEDGFFDDDEDAKSVNEVEDVPQGF